MVGLARRKPGFFLPGERCRRVSGKATNQPTDPRSTSGSWTPAPPANTMPPSKQQPDMALFMVAELRYGSARRDQKNPAGHTVGFFFGSRKVRSRNCLRGFRLRRSVISDQTITRQVPAYIAHRYKDFHLLALRSESTHGWKCLGCV